MVNREIAKIFREIGDILEIKKVAFKPQAYHRAASAIEALQEDLTEIWRRGGKKSLKEIPGIGPALSEKIEEFLQKGKIKEHQALKKSLPVDTVTLTQIEGVGLKIVKRLYKELRVKTLDDLEKAAKKGLIKKLEGFGPQKEQNILQGIDFLKKSRGRVLLGQILPAVKDIKSKLEKLKEVMAAEAVGSFRRKKETVGDVDFLAVSSKPEAVMDFFCGMPGVVKVWGRGPTKASVRLKDGFDMDLRVVEESSYGAALQYFTGSKEHNIAVRKIAMAKGLKLNEYGLFKGRNRLAGRSEKEIYKALGMEFPPPEIREDQGEVRDALKNNLPRLIELKDIKGDLHVHSDWDGGEHPIKDLAKKAVELGYEYLGISDHTKFLRIEKGLDENQLLAQRKEIEKLNKSYKLKDKSFRVLHGCEANIMKDGSLDIEDRVLSKLDYVIAGVHSQMKLSKKDMTRRIIKAMQNPNVDIISHPTGRLLKKREPYEIDFEEILKAARQTRTILEINSSPERLDLSDRLIRLAKAMGVKMIINTDTHQIRHFDNMKLGVWQARRGWAEKKDIVNCWPLPKFLKSFKG